MNHMKKMVWKKVLPVTLSFAITATGIAGGGAVRIPVNAHTLQSAIGQSVQLAASGSNSLQIRSKNGNSENDTITSAQADEMALALTNKIWVWDWVSFFVPYMSKDGVEKIIPASKKSEWAGSVDYTTGKKIKFTKKQVKAARKSEPEEGLTRKDIDRHALMIMQSNGDWDCISCMLPYMSRKGIRKVVRCYNGKHGGKEKRAEDYYN